HDNGGFVLINYLKQAQPGFKPKRILDMGCAIGASTLPWCDAFPDAEVHAIDVAAPCLLYGHARAEALGKTVHFSQQDAEHTTFPDGHFDAVVSCIVMHETATQALHNIFRESRRLLAKGGVALHMDAPQFDGKMPFEQFMGDWDTHYNAEPFMGTLHDLDLMQVMQKAGFDKRDVKVVEVPHWAPNHTGHRLEDVPPRHHGAKYCLVDATRRS
ncbi:MAG: class I SAM-dependent methyltransferase, partial [Alphaproteobacteria bacterium]|nr:class I SAM-dependent methyltransferase [Alphaproteobacteria bacterium]